MFYGRAQEVAELEELLNRAPGGRAATAVVRGEAGIGKSQLLDRAAATAADQGYRVLRVTGTEAESELAYAGLHLLLGRERERLDAVPEAQAEALRTALDTGASGQANRFLVGAAVLALLADLADDRPLLCVIDDAQWLDRASLEALLFAARRLDAEPLVLLFAVRDDLLPELHELPGAQLALCGLEPDAAAALLGARHADLPAAVVQWTLRESKGNPLALQVLPSLQRTDQMYSSPFTSAKSSTPHRIQRAFADRIAALPRSTQDFLLVTAADDTADPTVVLAAAAAIGAGRTDQDLAEEAGLLRLQDGRITFGHPLIRAAAYDIAAPAQRRAAHGVLAAQLDGGNADRRAWHLAAAATEPDEQVAAALDDTARRSHTRGGLAEATAAYRRAAELSPAPTDRCRRLAAAAAAAIDLGDLDHAGTLADQATALTTDPAMLAELTGVQAEVAREQDRPQAAYRSLGAAASFVATQNPAAAGQLLFQAADAAFAAGDLPAVEHTAERAEQWGLPGADRVRALAEFVAGTNPGLGDGSARGITALRYLLDGLDPDRLRERATLAYRHLLIADFTTTRNLSAALADECRRRGAVGVLTRALWVQARAEFILGRFTSAAATATEGRRLAAETGQRIIHINQSATLAMVAAARGDESGCLALTAEPLARDVAPANIHAATALSLLDLGLGRPDAAVDRLTALLAGHNRHGAIAAIPDLVEAAHRTGRPDEARTAFDWYRTWSEHVDRPWSRALAHRCAALLADDDTAETHYATALELHHTIADFGFDRARTELLYGEWLRRVQRRADARSHLRVAAETFRQLGAAPWADRAEGELRATGETRATNSAGDVLNRLTPQELQTAQLAATGLSNKDIGAQLFLSPRTVGYHLSNAYPKLGITSRRELAAVFRGNA
ncbi:helix-turn-helix transcriptional regulator [Nocardia mexicana]|uniref:Regulatory LuxR family protein n=1 Tax=Nocardia mexicana TaxID=279262 RepID=A0A370HD99_9NOCA|nr:LuxR family transcriptional regulator [Nocardia mexicana]RDI54385.1 regulatory LuxR family protein [Nocardia mexicana]